MASSPQQDLLYTLWLGICWNFFSPSKLSYRFRNIQKPSTKSTERQKESLKGMDPDEQIEAALKDRISIYPIDAQSIPYQLLPPSQPRDFRRASYRANLPNSDSDSDSDLWMKFERHDLDSDLLEKFQKHHLNKNNISQSLLRHSTVRLRLYIKSELQSMRCETPALP